MTTTLQDVTQAALGLSAALRAFSEALRHIDASQATDTEVELLILRLQGTIEVAEVLPGLLRFGVNAAWEELARRQQQRQ